MNRRNFMGRLSGAASLLGLVPFIKAPETTALVPAVPTPELSVVSSPVITQQPARHRFGSLEVLVNEVMTRVLAGLRQSLTLVDTGERGCLVGDLAACPDGKVAVLSNYTNWEFPLRPGAVSSRDDVIAEMTRKLLWALNDSIITHTGRLEVIHGVPACACIQHAGKGVSFRVIRVYDIRRDVEVLTLSLLAGGPGRNQLHRGSTWGSR